MSYNLMNEFTRPIFAAEHCRMAVLERGEDPADNTVRSTFVPKARFSPTSGRTVMITNLRTAAQVEYEDHSNHSEHCECPLCRQTITPTTTAVEGGDEVSSDVSRRTLQPWQQMDKAKLAMFISAMRRREQDNILPSLTKNQIEIVEEDLDYLENHRLMKRRWNRRDEFVPESRNWKRYRRAQFRRGRSKVGRPNRPRDAKKSEPLEVRKAA